MNTAAPPGSVSVTLESVAAVLAGLDAGTGWLGPAEQARLAAISAHGRRAQFLAGRYLARRCLAAHAGGTWQDYQLSAPEDAAPTLLAAPAAVTLGDLHFSLSHSSDYLACAVAPHPIGIDVEDSTRQRDVEALNGWIHEAGALSDAAGQGLAWFYAQWTLKEAWLKQLGSAANRPSMKAMRFIPAATAQETAAMTGSNAGLSLALYPAKAAQLALAGATLRTLEWRGWSVV